MVGAGTVSGPFDGRQYGLYGIFGTPECRSKASFVAYGRAESAVAKGRFQRMESFGAHAQPLAQGGSSHRPYHELLKGDGGVGVRAAVDDVHHGHGQHITVYASYVGIERPSECCGCGPGRGQRDAQDGVGTQPRLVGRAVEFYHAAVYGYLVKEAFPFECVGYLSVDVGDSVLHLSRRSDVCRRRASSRASLLPVDAPEGTDARPITPFSPYTSTSTVGLPRESRISRLLIFCIFIAIVVFVI